MGRGSVSNEVNFGSGGGENEVHRLGAPRKRGAPHITEQDGS